VTNFARTAAVLALLIGSAGVNAALAADAPPRLVELENPLEGPQTLQGHLRLPDGPGPFPAVVMLYGCLGHWRGIDERWGKRLAAWGYVTLTVNRIETREIESACTTAPPDSTLRDAYRALKFLAGHSSVDPARVAVVGFLRGGWLALLSVERGAIELSSTEKFRAAVAFYPPCQRLKGELTVPALILIGELDDWTPAKECRDLAEGRDDWGISRDKGKGVPIEIIVYPGAHHDFDVPAFSTPAKLLGYHLEFNEVARDQSIDALRKFLYATIGGKEKPP
jgi:dienelactone hydrolase